ncbi:MAG: hypothetical protein K2H60_04785 [Muribaculaceae bacterium]|nr:hypothetical protein [Muribaculaceae bacterium]
MRRYNHNWISTSVYCLLRLLSCFEPIPDSQLPMTSLLREFLDGSSFYY